MYSVSQVHQLLLLYPYLLCGVQVHCLLRQTGKCSMLMNIGPSSTTEESVASMILDTLKFRFYSTGNANTRQHLLLLLLLPLQVRRLLLWRRGLPSLFRDKYVFLG